MGRKCGAGGYARSLSRAVAGNRGSFFQRRPNLAGLLSAQRREPKSVLGSQCTHNFCRDHLFVAVRQRDFERYGFAQYESFGNAPPTPVIPGVPLKTDPRTLLLGELVMRVIWRRFRL